MAAQFETSMFVLAVHDLARARAHYIDVLGFSDMNVDAPGWAFLKRGGVGVRMGECADAIAPADLGDHSYFGYIYVDDVDAYHAEISARDADLIHAPIDQPWGMREMAVRTIDGHRIMFAQRLG